jgi:hypothetical protein
MINACLRSCAALFVLGTVSLASIGDAYGMAPPPPPPAPRDLYVSETGVDEGNNCLSSSNPCREIRKALVGTVSGDTVNVGMGVYQGFVIENVAGTSSRPVTIRKTPSSPGAVTIRGTAGDGFPYNTATVLVLNSSRVNLESLHIQGNELGLFISGGGNISVTDVNAQLSRTANLMVERLVAPLTIQGSYFVHANPGTQPESAQGLGGAIHLHEGDVTIGSSHFSQNLGNGLAITQGQSQARIELTGSRFDLNGGSGLVLIGRPNGFVRNNTFYRSGVHGVDVQGGPSAAWSHIEVSSNTVEQQSQAKEPINVTTVGSLGEATFTNNTLLHGSKGGMLYRRTGSDCGVSLNEVNSDYNIMNRVGMVKPDGEVETLMLRDFKAFCNRELNSRIVQ